MSGTARATSVACALAMTVMGGCADSSAGRPVPGNTGFSPTGDGSTEASEPARPRELRLDGADPCGLIPQSDWPVFYIEKPGRPQQNETFRSPECIYHNDVGGFRVTLVMTEGVDAWRGGKRTAQAEDAEPVAGFPTITVSLPPDKNRCDVAVDVADGQYLLASVLIDNGKLAEVPEKCEYAHQLAESAMSTLAAS